MRGRCPDRCRGCGRRGSQRPGFGVFPARASTVAEINGPARSGGGWAPPALTALQPVAPGRWNVAGLRPRPASAGRVASCRNTLAGWRRQAGATQEQQRGHAGAGGGAVQGQRAHAGARPAALCAAVPQPAPVGSARGPPPGSRGSSAGCRPEALGRGRAPWGSVGPCPRRMLRALACPPRSAWACRQPSQGRGFREETGSQSAFWGPCRGPGRSKALDDLPR